MKAFCKLKTAVAAVVSGVLTLCMHPARAVMVTAEELGQARHWAAANLESDSPTALPFSFSYGGKPLGEWGWKLSRSRRELDPQRSGYDLLLTNDKTGLQVRCSAVEYGDFPVVEWTLHFKNAGSNQTPILADIQALDLKLRRVSEEEFVLHHPLGDNMSPTSYQPQQSKMEPNSRRQFAPTAGRPTCDAYPYYNVAYDGGGLIVAVGWPGQWAAQFSRDATNTLEVAAGQELTHFKLLPGEEVRSPLVALLFWRGDRVRSQNIWRRWMLAHNLPRPGGKLPEPFSSICMGLHQSEAGEIRYMDECLRHGIKHDYWWMDAGWYPGTNWLGVGTWEPDPERFPRGIKPVSDHAHANGLKLVLWFEPERVTPGTWLYQQHPEWLLEKKLLNLGNPAARLWLTDYIDQFLTREGVDLYRQDFNVEPLGTWRANDPPDRQGLTEIRHVEGYLAFWDELRRRHPGLLIDSCAGGGRRNDLETLRRAVPLLRSDYEGGHFRKSSPQQREEVRVGNQGHTYGLASWVPFYGTGEFYDDAYSFRSHLCPAMEIGYDDPSQVPMDWEALRHTVQLWREAAPNFCGDYYPLTEYGLTEDVWMAWQFHRPEVGAGLVQAFRHRDSPYETARFKLQALDPKAIYVFTNLDEPGTTQQWTGQDLIENGFRVQIGQKPGAVVFVYRQAGRASQ